MKRYRKDGLHPVTLILNGRNISGLAESRTLLSDFLRHALGATGVHVGCEHGVCGACTVKIDGVAMRSCLRLAVQAEGCSVETVEGLNRDCGQELNELQLSFKNHHALQCGFCTAGILMSCDDYLRRVPNPSREQIKDMLTGHLCRCTGYTNIVDAVMDAAQRNEHRKEEV